MLCLVIIKHYNIFLPVSSSPKCSVGFPSVSGFNIWRVYLTSWFFLSSSSGSGSDRQTDWSTNMTWYRWGVGWASTLKLPVEFTSLSEKKNQIIIFIKICFNLILSTILVHVFHHTTRCLFSCQLTVNFEATLHYNQIMVSIYQLHSSCNIMKPLYFSYIPVTVIVVITRHFDYKTYNVHVTTNGSNKHIFCSI